VRELSLNILDIVQNSIAAGSMLTDIVVSEDTRAKTLCIEVIDRGCGMDEETLAGVMDPFYTTRTTRKVGMGIPLFKLAAEQTGGYLQIESTPGKGTHLKALFHTDSIDFTPLGDVESTIATIVGMNDDRDFTYTRRIDGTQLVFETAQIRQILEGVPLSEPAVMNWITGYLQEETQALVSNNL